METDTILKYAIAVGVPLLLIVIGAYAKAYARESRVTRKDWFFGVELGVAALGSTFLYVLELLRLFMASQPTWLSESIVKEKLPLALLFLFFLCLPVFVHIVSVHQAWEPQDDRIRAQAGALGFYANFLGAGLFCAFALLVKGA